MPRSDSIWLDIAHADVFPPLREHAHTGVCVIGAGIAGLTTARPHLDGIDRAAGSRITRALTARN